LFRCSSGSKDLTQRKATECTEKFSSNQKFKILNISSYLLLPAPLFSVDFLCVLCGKAFAVSLAAAHKYKTFNAGTRRKRYGVLSQKTNQNSELIP
jgi:hypothetical protein